MSNADDRSVVVVELRIEVYENGFSDSFFQGHSVITPAMSLLKPDRQIRFLENFKEEFALHADRYIAWLKGTRAKPELRVVKVFDE